VLQVKYVKGDQEFDVEYSKSDKEFSITTNEEKKRIINNGI